MLQLPTCFMHAADCKQRQCQAAAAVSVQQRPQATCTQARSPPALSAARHNTHLLLLRVIHFCSRYILSGSFGKESKCSLFLCEVVVDKKPLIRMEQAIAGAARIVGAVAEVGKAGTGRGSSETTGIPGGSQSELRPQGLLHQQEEILLGTTATPASSVTPSSLPATTSNATVTPMATTSTPSAVTPTSTPMAASTTSVGAALKDSSSQIPGQVPIVRNLDGTLANCILCREFRDYLILLDSKIPKPKFQVSFENPTLLSKRNLPCRCGWTWYFFARAYFLCLRPKKVKEES